MFPSHDPSFTRLTVNVLNWSFQPALQEKLWTLKPRNNVCWYGPYTFGGVQELIAIYEHPPTVQALVNVNLPSLGVQFLLSLVTKTCSKEPVK